MQWRDFVLATVALTEHQREAKKIARLIKYYTRSNPIPSSEATTQPINFQHIFTHTQRCHQLGQNQTCKWDIEFP